MPDSRYRITERIAAGGMAEVFKGVAESLQGFRKNIAIKRVLPALTKNKKFVAMFLDEARLSLHLQHANVVQMFDIGHADETYFIVMEFVDGVDLKAILEWRRRLGRPLTIGQTIYIGLEVCKALSYAHELMDPETGQPMGIVHRDVSPPNVLISRSGEVKLADFGLAKAASQLETTDPGVVKGKMSYLSPEAARGEEVDSRADIFSAGILMYEMLTGKRLFYGESDYQTVELVRASKIPSISRQNAEVESELEEICRKALARRVEDRFQSANDLQEALAHYLFSRGLKILQRDIADLVRSCIEDQATLSGAKKPKANIIDTLLHEEIHSFTSVEFEEGAAAAPQSAGLINADEGEYVDPRSWAEDADWPSKRKTTRTVRPPEHTPVPVAPASAKASSAKVAAPSGSSPSPSPVPKALPAKGDSGATPGPEHLVQMLEPETPPRGSGSHLRMGKGLLVGVLLGALAMGAILAAFVLG